MKFNNKGNVVKELRNEILQSSFDLVYNKYKIELINLYNNIDEKDLYDIIYELLVNKDKKILQYYLRYKKYYTYDRYLKYREYRQNVNRKDSSSLIFFKLVYGDELGSIKFKEKGRKSSHSLELYIERYGEFEGTKKYKVFKDKNDRSHTLEGYIDKHGEEEGLKRWNSFCERNGYTNTLEYNIEEYGIIEGTLRYNERLYHLNWNTKEQRLSEPERYNRIQEKVSYSLTSDGYLENNGLEAYKYYIKNKANNSLPILQERMGNKEGLKRYNKIRDKIKYSCSLSGYIDKHGEEGTKLYKSWKSSTLKNSSFVSKVSQKFCNILYSRLEELSYNLDKVYYNNLNQEYLLILEDRCYFYDWVDTINKICIEFNGDAFHANPNIYNKLDTPNPFNNELTSEEIWSSDKIKNDLLLENRDIKQIIIVWESDFKNDPDKVINDIIKAYNDI